MSRFSFAWNTQTLYNSSADNKNYTALDQTWRAAGALNSQTGSACDVVLDGPGFTHVAAAIHYGEETTLSTT